MFEAQRGNLKRAGGGIQNVIEKAREMGITDPAAPDASALRDVLAAYARAAGTAHLADTSRALLDEAAAKQGRLSLLAVQGSARGLDLSIDQLNSMGPDARQSHYGGTAGTDLTFDYAGYGAELRASSVDMQSQLIAGQPVDAAELDRLTLEADTVALRSRARVAILQLRSLRDAAKQAGEGLSAEIASWFSDEFGGLESMCETMWHRIDDAILGMDQTRDTPVYDHAKGKYNWPVTREGLNKAQHVFAEIAGNAEFVRFLRNGAELVQNQQFRTACVQVAAMIGISIAAGVVGAWVGNSMGGAMASRAGVAAVSELSVGARAVAGGMQVLTDAAINTAGQGAMMGTGFDGTLALENIVFSAGATAILRGFEHGAHALSEAQRATATIWRRVGSNVVLYEAAAITFHTIMGAALGYVSHLVVTQKSQPPPATLEEWFLQGASMAIGRHVGHAINAKLDAYKQISRANARGRTLYDSAKKLAKLANKVEKHPEATDALEVLTQQHELLAEEIATLEALADDPEALKRAGMTAEDIYTRALPELQEQLGEVHGRAGTEIDLHLSGLEEMIPGAVWRGTRDQIQRALDASTRQAKNIKDVRWTEGNENTPWTVTIEGRTYRIHERGEGVPPSLTDKRPGSRMVVAGDDAEMAAAAEWVIPIAGTLDVMIHGNSRSFEVVDRGGATKRDATWLAAQIRKGTKYHQIRLIACESGMDPAPLAQQLANELGVEVWAPSDLVWSREDGALLIGKDGTQSTGKWIQFKPQEGGKARTRHEADGHSPAPKDGAEDSVALGRRRDRDADDEPRDVVSEMEASGRRRTGRERDDEDATEAKKRRADRQEDVADDGDQNGYQNRSPREAGVVPNEGMEPMDRHHIFPQSGEEIGGQVRVPKTLT